MLRVTVNSEPDLTTVKLEGKLASVWVQEASKCADEIVATVRSQNVAVDLTDVTFVDDAGKKMLAVLAHEGVHLISDDPAMDAIVNEIVVRTAARPASLKAEPVCTQC